MGLSSRSRLRSTQGARLYTTAQNLVPGGLRGACPARSKSRNLGSSCGVAIRGAKAARQWKTDMLADLLHCCQGQQHGNNNRCHQYACAVMIYACVLCVRVYAVHVCRMLALGCVIGRTRTCKYFPCMPGRCLFPSIDRHGQFLLNSKPCFSSTPSLAGTQQQQHQQLECFACSSPCSMFPPM